MRLTLVTYGSEGDTRPLAALCRELLDRGHELRLFADRYTLSLPLRFGIPCEALAGDLKTTLPIADPKQELRIADVIQTSKALQASIATHSSAWLRAVAEHARNSDAVLFSSLAVGIGTALGEELNKPAIGLWFQPITPTRAFCSPMVPPMKLPGWANLMTYRLLHRQMWTFCGKAARSAREEVFGTSGPERFRFDIPMLYGVSRELVARPDDWPSSHHVCGHWSKPVDDWQPPTELVEFLATAEPPLYVGFGTPSSFVRAKALSAIVQAIGGRRAIFCPGWSNIDAAVLPNNFLVIRDVPHEWLFPRVSVAIHHGGAGTTHTAAIWHGIGSLRDPAAMATFDEQIRELTYAAAGIGLQWITVAVAITIVSMMLPWCLVRVRSSAML